MLRVGYSFLCFVYFVFFPPFFTIVTQHLWRSIALSTSCVSVCVCICLSVRKRMARSSSSGVTLSQGEGAILGVFFLLENALYGPYSGMNFVTKDRFGFNLLLYRKVGQNSISCN